MYSSLFAAVGSAVDAEADTQQFILPITIPLILSFVLIQPIMDNPDGNLALIVLSFILAIVPIEKCLKNYLKERSLQEIVNPF